MFVINSFFNAESKYFSNLSKPVKKTSKNEEDCENTIQDLPIEEIIDKDDEAFDDEDFCDEDFDDQEYDEYLQELSSYADNMELSRETGWFYSDSDERETYGDGLPYGFQWLNDDD